MKCFVDYLKQHFPLARIQDVENAEDIKQEPEKKEELEERKESEDQNTKLLSQMEELKRKWSLNDHDQEDQIECSFNQTGHF